MKADATTGSAVLSALHEYTEAYRLRDADRLMARTARDPDVVLIGTSADEWRVGPAEIRVQAERDWFQSESAAFDFTWTSVSAAGSIAWVAAEGVVRASAGGQEVTLPIQRTVVLEQRDDSWLLLQEPGSFPVAEQGEGESLPAD